MIDMLGGKCLIQLLECYSIFFVGNNGKHVTDPHEAAVFENEYSAYEYIDKRGWGHLAKVRKIVSKTSLVMAYKFQVVVHEFYW